MDFSKHLNTIIVTIASIAFLSIIPIFLFFIFVGGRFSNNAIDWAHFGNYSGGVLVPILSFCALITLLITIQLQVKELSETRKILEKTRLVQDSQRKILHDQLTNQTTREKRELTFHMLDRWTNPILRNHRLEAWNSLDKPGFMKTIILDDLKKNDLKTYNSFIEVCQFCSDYNKLLDQELLDKEICKLLFKDSLYPWCRVLIKIDFSASAENEDIGDLKSWIDNSVKPIKKHFEI